MGETTTWPQGTACWTCSSWGVSPPQWGGESPGPLWAAGQDAVDGKMGERGGRGKHGTQEGTESNTASAATIFTYLTVSSVQWSIVRLSLQRKH